MMVTVKRIGGSLAVVIPKVMAIESGVAEGTPLDVTRTPAGLLFRHPGRRPRRSTAAVAAAVDPASYARRSAELLADPGVGREVA